MSDCVHCGDELGADIGAGLFSHAHGLQRCQSSSVPYGHMGHPSMPCPPGDINPCDGYREDTCTHMNDKCTPYEVDGQTVLIRGSGEMTDEDKGFMAEIVRAAIRKARADREAEESEGTTE